MDLSGWFAYVPLGAFGNVQNINIHMERPPRDPRTRKQFLSRVIIYEVGGSRDQFIRLFSSLFFRDPRWLILTSVKKRLNFRLSFSYVVWHQHLALTLSICHLQRASNKTFSFLILLPNLYIMQVLSLGIYHQLLQGKNSCTTQICS